MRILAHVFSILAFGLSSILTVQLLISRAEGWLAVVMLALVGFVAEGGKGLLFYHGLSLSYTRRFTLSFACLATAGFLIFLSILGTVAALNLTESTKRAAEVRVGAIAQLSDSQIARAAELRKEAETLPADHRTARRNLLAAAYELEQQALSTRQTAEGSTGDYFDRIAAFLGISAAAAQMLIFWGYGFALELIACLLAVIATVPHKPTPSRIHLVKDTPKKDETTTPNQTDNPPKEKALLRKYIEEAYNAQRMRGFNKTTLTRSQWQQCVSTLFSANMLDKDNVGLVPRVPKEAMLEWVG